MAELTFYSSVRRGAALGITRQDDGTTPADADHARLQVTLTYDSTHTAQATLPLVGPGDIVGLDTRCIVRTFPRADDNDAEDAFLCYVDFDQADLPWRYTPSHYASGTISARADRVRPWLTLLVLAEGTEVTDDDVRTPTGKEKLPQLTVHDGTLLPNLADVWAWAHVQGGQVQSDEEIAAALAGRPGALVARLLSPRILQKSTSYRAFLVPTFMRGVIAARGENPGTLDGLAPAWDVSQPRETVLPIYHSWRFQTGTIGSFSEAARQLRPAAELPATVGQRQMDISAPGFLLTSPTGGTQLGMGGALQTADQADDPDPTLTADWLNGLSSFIDLGNLQGQSLRVVAPPLYGRWYAAEDHLDRPNQTPAPTNPPWFKLLNSDPRFRVAAGLGTEVVQRDQQAMLVAALEQTSRIVDNVNRVRRVMQTGREVFTRLITRHLPGTATGSTFLITSFLHGKILNCTGATPRLTIGGTLGGTPFFGPAHPWRRKFRGDPTILIETINRGAFNPSPANPPNTSTPDTTVGPAIPGGLPDPGVGTITSTMNADQRLYWGVVIFWVARRLLSTEAGKYWWLLRRLLRLGFDLIELASAQGAASLNVLQKLRAGTLLGPDIPTLPAANNFQPIFRDPLPSNPGAWPTARVPIAGADNPQASAFKLAAADLFNLVNGAPRPGPSLTRADVPTLVTCILNTLSPAQTLVAAEKSRHVLLRTITWNAADQLEPILVTPKISFPVWSLLRDVSPEWILPGVGDLPRNSVTLLETNQKFIEAFMAGLNHEMNRELLWNGYPTDQRGTYFQQFWDFRGWVKSDDQSDRTEDKFVDIVPIAEQWGRASDLGTHSGRVPPAQVVLLVRGDVIKRYPNVVVYASEAVSVNGTLTMNNGKQRFPVFQATLAGDIAFYGFELSAEDARGGTPNAPLGYFFVLQEHPAEPHFQKHGPGPNGSPADYAGVHFPSAVNVGADVPQQAYEQPTRVAIHGKDLLPA